MTITSSFDFLSVKILMSPNKSIIFSFLSTLYILTTVVSIFNIYLKWAYDLQDKDVKHIHKCPVIFTETFIFVFSKLLFASVIQNGW